MVTRSRLDPKDELDDAVAEMKRLGGDEEDEPTGRTEVNVTFAAPPIPQQPSSPHIEVSQPEPGVFRIAYTAVSQLRGWPLFWTLAVVAACYTFLRWTGKL